MLSFFAKNSLKVFDEIDFVGIVFVTSIVSLCAVIKSLITLSKSLPFSQVHTLGFKI